MTSYSLNQSVSSTLKTRLNKEFKMLKEDPPIGILSCLPNNENLLEWIAIIEGPKDTPYENGSFSLKIIIPARYPFEPPVCQFVTRIYHCNVDDSGRICLDILKSPPSGSWKPSINLRTMLMSLHLMMQDPNPDDPLLDDLAAEFKNNYPLYVEKAKKLTLEHAMSTPQTRSPDLSTHDSGKRQKPGQDQRESSDSNYLNPKMDETHDFIQVEKENIAQTLEGNNGLKRALCHANVTDIQSTSVRQEETIIRPKSSKLNKLSKKK